MESSFAGFGLSFRRFWGFGLFRVAYGLRLSSTSRFRV